MSINHKGKKLTQQQLDSIIPVLNRNMAMTGKKNQAKFEAACEQAMANAGCPFEETPSWYYTKGYAPHHQAQIADEINGNTVAITYNDEDGRHARIMAAALELLAALQKCALHVSHYAAMPHAHPDAHRDAAEARHAIEKATTA